MPEALVLPFPKRGETHPPVRPRTRPTTSAGLTLDDVDAIEIIAPDGYCAALLQNFTSPSFPAEIVPGSNWIVRFHPPPSGGDWVVELLSLVERWLVDAPLPCAIARKGNTRLVRDAQRRARFLYPPTNPTQAA